MAAISSLIAAGTAAAGIYSASKSAKAQKSAAQTVANATDRAAELQNEQFNRVLDLQRPGYRTGQAALGVYSTALGLPGFDLVGTGSPATTTGFPSASPYGLTTAEIGLLRSKYSNPNTIANQVRSTPGYQTQLQEGLKAIEGSAAARGSLRSGRTLAGLQDYGQRTFGSYYDKWLANVGGLAGLQTAAAGQIGGAGQAAANNIGNLGVQGAQAQAAGQTGAANAWAGGIGGLLGTLGSIPWGGSTKVGGHAGQRQ